MRIEQADSRAIVAVDGQQWPVAWSAWFASAIMTSRALPASSSDCARTQEMA
jgi:hypothetical protein